MLELHLAAHNPIKIQDGLVLEKVQCLPQPARCNERVDINIEFTLTGQDLSANVLFSFIQRPEYALPLSMFENRGIAIQVHGRKSKNQYNN